MSNYLNKNVLLVGAGQMALDYHKVLIDLGIEFEVVGRSEQSSDFYYNQTGIRPFVGGLEKYLKSGIKKNFSHAIVAVNETELCKNALELIEFGLKNILIEKPGVLNRKELNDLHNYCIKYNLADVYIGYNRRFYASTQKALEIITLDKGVKSFSFDFTEWSHKIESLNKDSIVKKSWFLCNSTHVLDLSFFLGGFPKEISTFYRGKLDWHPSASIFSGSGITDKEALFSYHANWSSPGRWGLEVNTNQNKLIFRPLEKLQIQQKGSTKIEFIGDINYSLDEKYKPGLFLQVSKFLSSSKNDTLLDIYQFKRIFDIYLEIANYRENSKD